MDEPVNNAPAGISDNAADSDSDSGIDPGMGSGKMFDISSDLNISPVDPGDADNAVAGDAALNVPLKGVPIKIIRPIVPAAPKVVPPPVREYKPGPENKTEPMPAPLPSHVTLPDRVVPADPRPKTIPSVTSGPIAPYGFSGDSAMSGLTLPKNVGATAGNMPLMARFQAETGIKSEPTAEPKISPLASAEQAHIKPIRTYESDIAEVLSHTHASSASIAIAENKRQTDAAAIGNAPEPVRAPGHAVRNLFVTLLILILLGGGAYGAYYLYTKSPLAQTSSTTPAPEMAPSIIPVDFQSYLHIDNLTPAAIQSHVAAEAAKSQPAGTIKEIIPVLYSNGATVRVPASDMIAAMDLSAPDMLIRSLDPEWMLGIYAAPDGTKSVFVMATNNFFQNAFAGMLQWESVMPDDLKSYLYPLGSTPSLVRGVANVGTSTATIQVLAGSSTASTTFGIATSTRTASSTARIATSTASTTLISVISDSIKPYFTVRGQFQDRIVQNRDVREFIDANGGMVFLYSFVDNTKLVVTGSEAALTEIITRLEKQALLR